MTDRTTPSSETRAAGAADADAAHEADRPPTSDEEAAAPEEVDEATADAYREMAEKGAETKGEGRLP